MKKSGFSFRVFVFICGLFFMSFGVALSVKANLGVSPISCIPYVFSFKFPFTLGELTIAFNVLLIILQVIILRKNFHIVQLIQLPVVILFGFFIDLSMYATSSLHVSNYILQMLLCLLSCIIMGWGVFLEVKSKVTYLAGEGVAISISQTLKKEFGKAKVSVDSSMVILGILCSFLFFHKLLGIREGTVASAILVGLIARFFSKKVTVMDGLMGYVITEKGTVNTPEGVTRKEKPVITISREYGSGGHEIGQIIAKKLGISFYDNKLIKLTAEKSGFTPEYIKNNEQKLVNSLIFDLYEQNYAYVNEQRPPQEALFLIQSKIIREICEEPCVITGRCANFILKDNPNCFNVFIHANNEYRRKKIVEEYKDKDIMTDKDIEKADKERARYCQHYTGKSWRDSSNYDISIDSSLYNPNEAADLIIAAVEKSKIPA